MSAVGVRTWISPVGCDQPSTASQAQHTEQAHPPVMECVPTAQQVAKMFPTAGRWGECAGVWNAANRGSEPSAQRARSDGELGSQLSPGIKIQPFGTYLVVDDVAGSKRNQAGIETISQVAYDKLERTWRALHDGSGKVRFNRHLTIWQRAKLLQAFATLLQQAGAGRELAMRAVWEGYPTRINAGLGALVRVDLAHAKGYDLGAIQPWQDVFIPLYRDLEVVYDTFDDGYAVEKDHHIVGHELGHGIDSDHLPERRAAPHPQYDNSDEAHVITTSENPLHDADNTPRRATWGIAYWINLPLDEPDRETLRSVARAENVGSASKPLRALCERLLALGQDPEISPIGRQLCLRGALHLLSRFSLLQFGDEVLEQNAPDFVTVYEHKFMNRDSPVPNFRSFGWAEMVLELQRLKRAGAEHTRTEGEHDAFWRSLDRLNEVLEILTFDLESLTKGYLADKDFQRLYRPEVERALQ